MSMIFFTFRAQMAAKRASTILHQASIPARMGRTPSRIAGRGCGYGIWVRETDLGAAAGRILGAGLRYEKTYLTDGTEFREVWL